MCHDIYIYSWISELVVLETDHNNYPILVFTLKSILIFTFYLSFSFFWSAIQINKIAPNIYIFYFIKLEFYLSFKSRRLETFISLSVFEILNADVDKFSLNDNFNPR